MVYFLLAFVLVGAFANANTEITNNDIQQELKIEVLDNGEILHYSIVIDEFDVCTITVTLTFADGVTVRGRATSNTGDCDAATAAALAEAFRIAAEIGY